MHFCCLSPVYPSHVAALAALAEPLAARGHRVTLVHRPAVGRSVPDGALGFAAIDDDGHRAAPVAAMIARAARPGLPFGLRRVIRDMADATDLLCDRAPELLSALDADAVIADEMEAAGALVAARLNLPFVSLAAALPVERDPALPLPVMGFSFDAGPAGRRRNAIAASIHDRIMRPHADTVAAWCRRFGLAPRRSLADLVSPLGTLAQTVAAFDLPRALPAPRLHHLGPFRRGTGPAPREDRRRDGPPRVFASLGTLQGWRFGLFRRIADGCRRAGAEVTIAHCGGLSAGEAARLDADEVVAFAPQQRAIADADVVVTHGGLNTVMDAMAVGVPVLVLPIAFDQPGVAARVLHHGVGLSMNHHTATPAAIARSVRVLLEDPRYRRRAAAMSVAVADAGGAGRAAEVVESLLGARPLARGVA